MGLSEGQKEAEFTYHAQLRWSVWTEAKTNVHSGAPHLLAKSNTSNRVALKMVDTMASPVNWVRAP